MCGIYGAIRLKADSPPIDVGAARRMHLALKHRGGDGEAVFRDDWAFVGLSRLAIVGTREPAQVFWDPAKQHVAVMNGEIYNHQALRDVPLLSSNDTAVVPHLYASRGSGFVHDLIGEYAIALYTPATRCLRLIRDRLGVKPLFIAQTADYLVFASEIAAIVASKLVPVAIDSAAAALCIVRGVLPESITLIKGVTMLPPGHRLEVFDGNVTIQRYWSAAAAGWQGDIEDLSDIVRDAVMIRARAEKSIAAALSGGLDSTLVTTLARANVARAYTLAVPDADESALASATCKRMALSHTIVTAERPQLSVIGDADARTFGITGVVDQLARAVHDDGHKVIIGGEGADELFLGYPWHHLRAATENIWPLRKSPHDPHDKLINAYAAILARGDGDNALEAWLRIFDGAGWQRAEQLAPELAGATPLAYVAPPTKSAHARQEASLGIDMLAGPVRIADRIWMRHAVEVRTPFLDHRLVEAVVSLSAETLEAADADKPVLRAIADELLPGFKAPIKKGLAAWPRPSKDDVLSWAQETFAGPCVAVDAHAALRLYASSQTDDVALHVLWHTLVLEQAARPLLKTHAV